MRESEKITSVILAEAEAAAEDIIARANAAKTAKLEALEADFADASSARLSSLSREKEATVARKLTVAGLDARMSSLASRRRVMEKAFDRAYEKIATLGDGEYRAFYGRLIEKYVGDGDIVAVAAEDKKRLDAKWLEGVSKKIGKKLKLSESASDGAYGIVIMGKSCEVDLTLGSLISEVKTECESEVLAALFG